MYLTFRVKISETSSPFRRSQIETDDRELSIDLPDNLPMIELGTAMQSVILAAVEEYRTKQLAAKQTQTENPF